MNDPDPHPISSESSDLHNPLPVTASSASDKLNLHESRSTPIVDDASSLLDQTTATDLAHFLTLGTDHNPQWSTEDLAQMLQHQMSTSLSHELQCLEGVDPQHLQDVMASVTPSIYSFGDLLTHPHPPVALLQYTKDYAKACRDDQACPLPASISSTLYYACLAAAQLRCHQCLTSMPSDDVARGFDWTLRQEWMHPDLYRLFEKVRERPI